MKIIKKAIIFSDNNPDIVGLVLSFLCLCSLVAIIVTNPEISQLNQGWQVVGIILLGAASIPVCFFACGVVVIFFGWTWNRLVYWASKE